MIHELKLREKYVGAVKEGRKLAEVRQTDRDFQAGDHIDFVDDEGLDRLFASTFTITHVMPLDLFGATQHVMLSITPDGLL